MPRTAVPVPAGRPAHQRRVAAARTGQPSPPTAAGRDEVKQRYLNATALKDGSISKANDTLQKMLANSGFLSRPAELLENKGYGLPQPEERKQLEKISSERQAQLLRLSTDTDKEVRALLEPSRAQEIAAVEANVKQIGVHLRELHKAAGGLQLPDTAQVGGAVSGLQRLSCASPGKSSSRCNQGNRLLVQMCRLARTRSGWSRVATVTSMLAGLCSVSNATCAPQLVQK